MVSIGWYLGSLKGQLGGAGLTNILDMPSFGYVRSVFLPPRNTKFKLLHRNMIRKPEKSKFSYWLRRQVHRTPLGSAEVPKCKNDRRLLSWGIP